PVSVGSSLDIIIGHRSRCRGCGRSHVLRMGRRRPGCPSTQPRRECERRRRVQPGRPVARGAGPAERQLLRRARCCCCCCCCYRSRRLGRGSGVCRQGHRRRRSSSCADATGPRRRRHRRVLRQRRHRRRRPRLLPPPTRPVLEHHRYGTGVLARHGQARPTRGDLVVRPAVQEIVYAYQ
ncbi:unnamed protein product, partial [Ectocarpus sp. 12 AP-2014]